MKTELLELESERVLKTKFFLDNFKAEIELEIDSLTQEEKEEYLRQLAKY